MLVKVLLLITFDVREAEGGGWRWSRQGLGAGVGSPGIGSQHVGFSSYSSVQNPGLCIARGLCGQGLPDFPPSSELLIHSLQRAITTQPPTEPSYPFHS